MFDKIKNKIDFKLKSFIIETDKLYSLSKISPLLFSGIQEFILRPGKRIRPCLFLIGYMGFSKKRPRGLYESALAMELLHDFMLIHDDIIDKSATRRGKPSMHAVFNKKLSKYSGLKFNGQDLSIVTGDILYAIAIRAFLAIDENPRRKEKSLRQFIKAAASTGVGEFIELTGGLKPLDKTTKADIYNIYDYKTSDYTFSTPLACGAILAGAPDKQIKKLRDCGIYLGRAFQIKDDLSGLFGEEKKIGKSTLSDLQEAKKTLIIWHLYNNSKPGDKKLIRKIFTKKKVIRADILKVRRLAKTAGSLAFAEGEIINFNRKATAILDNCSMNKKYKKVIRDYYEN